MRISLSIANFTWPDGPDRIGRRVGRLARIADQAGFHTLWVMDHLFQIGMNGPAELDMLEGYTTLAYAAGQTERIRLGTLVTAAPYRHPGVLVKTVTTLDVLSGGRAWLGIGAAWNGREAEGLGIPFPPTKERFDRLEEVLRIALRMWRGDRTPYDGEHYHLADPLNSPNALTRPHPPILVGGMGERRTLRYVAKYADACNLFDIPDGEAIRKHKLAVLREHCEGEGRDYDEIEKTIAMSVAISRDGRDDTDSPARVLERLAELAASGMDHAIVAPPGPWDEESLHLLGELVPDIEAIVPAGR
ncbi:TIGR03560 family F420-dependent LLM class oxidoreductase [Actinopolymorpha rutila]|uniref:F420-dependent oxidoreductase-like protein n=1 Tax=Actinopolymorpha rutila TaxID=446787 RepID=A0A852ZKJ0_9ACTN|nr:F420-dependent oxidoreductase-like protein [Actinopolymorpha rutila]